MSQDPTARHASLSRFSPMSGESLVRGNQLTLMLCNNDRTVLDLGPGNWDYVLGKDRLPQDIKGEV